MWHLLFQFFRNAVHMGSVQGCSLPGIIKPLCLMAEEEEDISAGVFGGGEAWAMGSAALLLTLVLFSD